MTRAALPVYNQSRAGTEIVSWANTTGWSAEVANATIALETTNKTPTGDNGLKVSQPVTTGGSGRGINYALSFSMYGPSDVVEVPIYLPTDHIGGSVLMGLASGGTYADYYQKSLTSTKTLKGWNLYSYALSEMTKTGSPNLAAMTSLRCYITCPSGVTTYAIFGPITVSRRTRPKVIVMFDDGLLTTYTVGKPIMDTYGIQPTLALVTDNTIAGGPTIMTPAQLNEVYAEGWDLVSHTASSADLTGEVDPYSQCLSPKQYLESQGWTRTSDVLVYPGGAYNDTVREAAALAGVVYGLSTQNVPIRPSADGYIYQKDILGRYSFDSGSRTVADLLIQVDSAIKYGHTIAVYGHGIVASGPSATELTTANFTTLCAGLAARRDQGLIDIVTFSEWRDGLAGRRVDTSRLSA